MRRWMITTPLTSTIIAASAIATKVRPITTTTTTTTTNATNSRVAAGDGDNHSDETEPESAFRPQRAVIVSKLSMMEYELNRLAHRTHIQYAGVEDPRFLKEVGIPFLAYENKEVIF